MRKQGGRILIVDDDSLVREMVGRVLAFGGYVVAQAASAAEALQFLSGSEIELLITDIRMPEMDGLELARRVKRKSPGVRILYITGYSDEPLNEGSQVLHKPFTHTELLATVAGALEGNQ